MNSQITLQRGSLIFIKGVQDFDFCGDNTSDLFSMINFTREAILVVVTHKTILKK